MEIHNKNRPLKFGVAAFLTFATLLIILIVYIIGSNQRVFDSKYPLYMFLPNVQGLESGAFVTLSGLKVGVVGDLSFSRQDEEQGILIELKINRKYAPMITTSSRATIKTMGILGDKYVDITLGDLDDPKLQGGDYLTSITPLDADALLNMASNTMAGLQGTLDNINQITHAALSGEGMLGLLVQDNTARQNLVASLGNLKRITDRVVAGRGSVGQFLSDTTMYSSLNQTVGSLTSITGKIERGEGSMGKLVNDASLYDRFSRIATRTDSLLAKLNSQDGSAGKLINDKELYDQLVNLSKSLNELTTDFKANPKKYVSFSFF